MKKSNKRGFVTFAKAPVPNSRSTQLFINFVDNSRLDADGFAPIGHVIEGMEAVDKINKQYGAAPQKFADEGNKVLEAKFPKLDGIKKATIVEKK